MLSRSLWRWLQGTPRRCLEEMKQNFRAAREATACGSLEAEVAAALKESQQENERLCAALAESTREATRLHDELDQARRHWEEGLMAVKHAQEFAAKLEEQPCS